VLSPVDVYSVRKSATNASFDAKYLTAAGNFAEGDLQSKELNRKLRRHLPVMTELFDNLTAVAILRQGTSPRE